MQERKSVLINPILARGIGDSHRAATPLELFYDLIYVVAIASLALQLHHALSDLHHVGATIAMYFWFFWAIWWPWNSYTWFASGYDTDDAQFRLASFAQMVGAIIIAVGVKSAFKDGNFIVMMVGYITMRIPYVLLWLKVAYDDPHARPIAKRYAIGVTLVQVCWVLAILYYQSWYVFIAIAFLEMFVPYYAERSVDKGKNTKYHFGHIEERLGLLTIIVLGESILASVYAVSKTVEHFSYDLASLVVGSLLILFSMWWLYFDDELGEELRHEHKSFIWSYGHYFIYAAATAVGALISVNVDVLTDHAKISHEWAVIGLGISVAFYLASVWFCHDFLLNKTGVKRYELLILAIIVLGIAFFFKSILLVGFAFVCLNAIRLIRKHKQFQALNS